MMRDSKSRAVSAVLLVAFFTGSVLSLRHVESLQGKDTAPEETLYLPSGKVLKRMSLGYSGLLANIYWTRTVQYFGANLHRSPQQFGLLAPLLEITTDLDPALIPAYQNGAIFLSQRPPAGAGQPDKAAALLEKGVRENPGDWRLYFTLGFVHYLDRRDYQSAQQAFARGAAIPGALPYMKVMAARMAERTQDTNTALALWMGIHEMSNDKMVRDNALQHIASLRAAAEMDELARRAASYREQTGKLPSTWSDLVHVGLLRGIPRDPTGDPYKLEPDGTISVLHEERFPFLREARQRH